MNKLGEVLNRPESTMAVVFTGHESDQVIDEVAAIADVAELRADLPSFREQNYSAARDKAQRLAKLPVLLTARMFVEGGHWISSEKQRLKLFSAMMPHVDGVDVEIRSRILLDVINAAHEQGRVVIASSHNYEATPSMPELDGTFEHAKEMGADYVKFAATPNNDYDYDRLIEVTGWYANDGIIVVAMGDEYGPKSRSELPSYGSCLTYAFPGSEPLAPGQMNYLETHEALKASDPGYAALF